MSEDGGCILNSSPSSTGLAGAGDSQGEGSSLLLSLGDDALAAVLSCLSTKDKCRAAATCRTLAQLCSSRDALWAAVTLQLATEELTVEPASDDSFDDSQAGLPPQAEAALAWLEAKRRQVQALEVTLSLGTCMGRELALGRHALLAYGLRRLLHLLEGGPLHTLSLHIVGRECRPSLPGAASWRCHAAAASWAQRPLHKQLTLSGSALRLPHLAALSLSTDNAGDAVMCSLRFGHLTGLTNLAITGGFLAAPAKRVPLPPSLCSLSLRLATLEIPSLVTASTQLTSLSLAFAPQHAGSHLAYRDRFGAGPLSTLTNLASLTLSMSEPFEDTLVLKALPLAVLSRLRHLGLACATRAQELLPEAPKGLTSLQVDFGDICGVSQELSRFTGLRQLSLAGLRPGHASISCGHQIAPGGGPTDFHDTLAPLLALTQLSRLCLRHCAFLKEPSELEHLPALAVLELDGAVGIGPSTLRCLQRLRRLSLDLPLAAACTSELAAMTCLRRLDLSMLCQDSAAQRMGQAPGWQGPGSWNWASALPALFAALAGLPLLETLGLSPWLPREWEYAVSLAEGSIGRQQGAQQALSHCPSGASELACAVAGKAGPLATGSRRGLAYIQPLREGLQLLRQQGKPVDLVVYEPPGSACWGLKL